MRPCQSALFVLCLLAAVPKGAAVEVPAASGVVAGLPLSAGVVPSSDFVKGVQRQLKRAGYDPGIEDGKMGPATRDALKRFQDGRGLPSTGEPDVPTLIQLLQQSLQR